MQTLRGRFIGHRSTIRGKSGPVGTHFSGRGHSQNDMQVSVLQSGFKSATERLIAEQKFVREFGLIENGLNIDKDFMSHYTL